MGIIIQPIKTWMSDRDIGAAQRWNAELAKELSESQFGIICLTTESLTSPWLMFEAGTLAKSLEETRIVLLLCGVDFSDLPGPLAQFQAVSTDKNGLWHLTRVLHEACEGSLLTEPELKTAFEATWPQLESRIDEIREEVHGQISLQDSQGSLLFERGDHLAKAYLFQAPNEGKYNKDFYKFFTGRIANAKSDIYVTGNGFECADREGQELARSYSKAFEIALENGVHVVRVQTKPTSNLVWAQMLADLVKNFSGQFSLHIVREGVSTQLSSVCVIDPDVPRSNLVELMLSTSRLFGARAADLAGTAVFIEGQHLFALDLRQGILKLANSDLSISPATHHDVINLLVGEEYYFSYGSNMNRDQMKKRCGSARLVGVGVLRDHRLVFNRRGTYRPGGVASVLQSHGERVYGIIWGIHPLDFADLDAKEDPEAYRRSLERVRTLDGEEYDCSVYKAIPQGNFFQPDLEYLELLINAAREAKLPDSYIAHLTTLKGTYADDRE